MEPKDKFIFCSLVFFFCGSVTLIAAHDLAEQYRNRRGDRVAARRLIEQLKGVQPPTRASLRRDFDDQSTMDQWKGKQYEPNAEDRSSLGRMIDRAMSDDKGK